MRRTPSGLILPDHAAPRQRHHVPGKGVAKLGDLRVWAENGSVCMVLEGGKDGKDDEFTQLQPSEARNRYHALVGQYEAMKASGHAKSDELQYHARFLEVWDGVIKQAEKQGPFEDAASRRDRARRRKKQVRGVDVKMSGSKPITHLLRAENI